MKEHISTNKPQLLVTGPSGQVGRLVIERTSRLNPDDDITAMVRFSQAADPVAPFGVATRNGDYINPRSLDAAVTDIERLLLISSSVLGQRLANHDNAVAAVKQVHQSA